MTVRIRGLPTALAGAAVLAAFTLAPVAPFDVLGGGSYVALTQWSDDPGGHASGSFDLFYGNATIGGVFEFSGRFNTDVCPGLDGVQLP